jgi:hypothetical protein
MTLSKEELKNVLLGSYDLVVRAPWEKKYEIKSRTKIKSLIESLVFSAKIKVTSDAGCTSGKSLRNTAEYRTFRKHA